MLCHQRLVPKITNKEKNITYKKRLKSSHKEWFVISFGNQYIFSY